MSLTSARRRPSILSRQPVVYDSPQRALDRATNRALGQFQSLRGFLALGVTSEPQRASLTPSQTALAPRGVAEGVGSKIQPSRPIRQQARARPGVKFKRGRGGFVPDRVLERVATTTEEREEGRKRGIVGVLVATAVVMAATIILSRG